MKYLIIFFVIISFSAQAIRVDSLVDITQKNAEYHLKYDAYEKLISYYQQRNIDSAKYFVKQFLRLGEVHQDKKFLAKAYEYSAEIAANAAAFDDAIKYYQKAYQIYLFRKDTLKISEALKSIGRTYSDNKNTEDAIKYYLQSLELKLKIGDKRGSASIYNEIGSLYYIGKNDKEALKYYNKSLEIVKDLGFKLGVAMINLNLGSIYFRLDSLSFKNIDTSLYSISDAKEKSKQYFQECLRVGKEIHRIDLLADAYSNLSALDSINSIQYSTQALEYRRKMHDVSGQWTSLYNIANRYFDLKEYNLADKYIEEASEIALQYLPMSIPKTLKLQASILAKKNNYRGAYFSISDYIRLKDSLDQAKKNTEYAELERKWNYEKNEKENQLLTKNKQLDEERIAKQRLYLWASGLGLLLFSFLIFFIFRGYRQKQKANQLLSKQKEIIEDANHELNQQNEEIVAQRDEIEKQRDVVTEQKDQIEEIHREVSESIDYAKRLQGAILPKQDLLRKSLDDFFVLFMPKDKVSGDYYWWTEVEGQTIITAADCTGHGVPGAFMSMLGVSFLKEIVNKEFITQPNIILNKLRKEIIKTLDQKGVSGEQKDGMDMCLVSLNLKNNKVQFSAANNPLYIVSNKDISEQLPHAKVFDEGLVDSKLYELKPDKMPIAIYEKMDSFTNTEIQLEKGDILYMFSDGYADQFGGPKGKKFMYKPFKRLLLQNSQKSMAEQKSILKQAFQEWRGGEEQVDDVVVIGLKV